MEAAGVALDRKEIGADPDTDARRRPTCGCPEAPSCQVANGIAAMRAAAVRLVKTRLDRLFRRTQGCPSLRGAASLARRGRGGSASLRIHCEKDSAACGIDRALLPPRARAAAALAHRSREGLQQQRLVALRRRGARCGRGIGGVARP